MGNDFIVESKGHCFICLERTILQKSHVKNKGDADLVPLSPVYSLQSLSRCLKMDMAKVFNQREPIPQHLLDQVQTSKLNAELCEECVMLNDKVTKLCRQLEKIELELASSLTVINEKFVKSEANFTGTGLMADAGSGNSRSDWKGKLEILENLRKEATQKCFRKLKWRRPLINVQNLTMKQIKKKKLKLKGTSPIHVGSSEQFSASEISEDVNYPRHRLEARDVKAESPPEDEDDKASHYDDDNSDMIDEDRDHESTTHDQGEETGSGSVPFAQMSQSNFAERGKQEREYIFNPATGKYKCTACSKELFDQSTARRHYISIHQKVKYKCGLCKKEFTLLASYKRHHKSVHLGVRFQCAVCNKTFYSKDTLRTHMKRGSSCGDEASGHMAQM